MLDVEDDDSGLVEGVQLDVDGAQPTAAAA